jgi:hypothetical protein
MCSKIALRAIVFGKKYKGKGKGYPRTGHEGPERE